MIGFLGTGCKGRSQESPLSRHPRCIPKTPYLIEAYVLVADFPYRIFTLEEANRAVPDVTRLTAHVQDQLSELRRAYDENDPSASRELEQQTRELLQQWQDAIREIGAAPKGIFTVDFRSPDLNVLWCWTQSESEISHRHYTWESFKDRVELAESRCWPSNN